MGTAMGVSILVFIKKHFHIPGRVSSTFFVKDSNLSLNINQSQNFATNRILFFEGTFITIDGIACHWIFTNSISNFKVNRFPYIFHQLVVSCKFHSIFFYKVYTININIFFARYLHIISLHYKYINTTHITCQSNPSLPFNINTYCQCLQHQYENYI